RFSRRAMRRNWRRVFFRCSETPAESLFRSATRGAMLLVPLFCSGKHFERAWVRNHSEGARHMKKLIAGFAVAGFAAAMLFSAPGAHAAVAAGTPQQGY